MIIPSILISCIILKSSAQILQLDVGKVQGFDYQTTKGDTAEVYLNIPYASPPVENLRFRRPRPAVEWSEIRDGKAFGPVCHPLVKEAVPSGAQASEDCLTLNIIRPKKQVPI
ncbi:unnamed protein product, partial [Strongylus vulgaris]